MDEPDSAEASCSESVFREIRNKYVFVCADEHVPDAAGAVDNETDLPAYFRRGFS